MAVSPTQTRRSFLVASAGALAGLVATSRAPVAAAADAVPAGYRSRPDLTPPRLTVDHLAPGTAHGYVFAAPFTGQTGGNALIVDETGEPVWIHQKQKLIMNFRAQTYRGQPVLTWWEGSVGSGYFTGECVVADRSYREVARFAAGNGFVPEVHEFLITADDTALVTINNFVATDLTPWDGPADGTVVEGVVQEIDPETREVLFEWHSLEHVSPDESPFPVSAVWDYLHLNSVDVDPDDGNLVVSARYPSTVYKLDRKTGEVLWRLGGASGDFALGEGARFSFQHDARAHRGGLLTVFDDGADSPVDPPEPVSRAVTLQLDPGARTAELVSAYPNPAGALTVAMGSAQRLATGGMFVGWGTVAQVSEFDAHGSLVFDGSFPSGYGTYRAFRSAWPGRATGRPAIAAFGSPDGTVEAYGSWNGATRVTHWRLLGGSSASTLHPLKTVPRSGFETRVAARGEPALVALAALDRNGTVLATSRAVAPIT